MKFSTVPRVRLDKGTSVSNRGMRGQKASRVIPFPEREDGPLR